MAATIKPQINQLDKCTTRQRLGRTFSLHRLLLCLLRACQLFGVAPLKKDKTTTTTKVKAIVTDYLYYLWCLALFLYICFVNYLQSMRIPSDKPTAEKALYGSVFLTNCIIVLVTIINAQYRNEYFISVPNELKELVMLLESQKQKLLQYQYHHEDQNEHHQNKHNQPHHHRRKHHYNYYMDPRSPNDQNLALNIDDLYRELRNLIAMISFFIACCFFVNLLLVHYDLLAWLRSSSAYNLPQVLISLNLGQHWLAMRCNRELFRGINECLRKFLPTSLHENEEKYYCWIRGSNKHNNSKNKTNSIPKISSLGLEVNEKTWFRRKINFITVTAAEPLGFDNLLENLRNIYARLDDMNSRLIQGFGLVLLLNILATFMELSVEIFSIYAYYDHPEEFTLILVIYKMLWIILHVGRMFFILLPNNAIIIEKCRICFHLHQLSALSESVERTINRFLVQLMVSQRTKSACGILGLDLMLLGGMIGALSMFIIFLIQIDMERKGISVVEELNDTVITVT